MLELKPNDIIINGTNERTVVYVSKNKERIAYEDKDDFLTSCAIEVLISNGYTKKETPWVPTVGYPFFYINSKGEIIEQIWEGTSKQIKRIEWGNCFPTKEVALARKAQIIGLIKN